MLVRSMLLTAAHASFCCADVHLNGELTCILTETLRRPPLGRGMVNGERCREMDSDPRLSSRLPLIGVVVSEEVRIGVMSEFHKATSSVCSPMVAGVGEHPS